MTASSASSASPRAARRSPRRNKPADSADIIIRLTAEEQETLRAILAETDPAPRQAWPGRWWLAALALAAALLGAAGAWMVLDPAAPALLHDRLAALLAALGAALPSL